MVYTYKKIPNNQTKLFFNTTLFGQLIGKDFRDFDTEERLLEYIQLNGHILYAQAEQTLHEYRQKIRMYQSQLEKFGKTNIQIHLLVKSLQYTDRIIEMAQNGLPFEGEKS